MNLSSQPVLKVTYDHDTGTGLVTVTFLSGDDTSLGDIIMENNKFKAFVDSLYMIVKERNIDAPGLMGQMTNYSTETNQAVTEFR